MISQLKSKDLVLKHLEYHQVDDLARIANNKKIWLNVRNQFPYPYTLEHAKDFIKKYSEKKNHLSWAINYKNQLAGMIGLHRQADVYAHSLEIGYWIGEEFWGKGIASTSVKLACDYAFENTDINRIWAGLYDYNLGSKRVLEKCGFEYEGCLKKAVFKDGKFVDELRYALVKS